MNRRHLIKVGGAALVAASLPSLPQQAQAATPKPRVTYIVPHLNWYDPFGLFWRLETTFADRDNLDYQVSVWDMPNVPAWALQHYDPAFTFKSEMSQAKLHRMPDNDGVMDRIQTNVRQTLMGAQEKRRHLYTYPINVAEHMRMGTGTLGLTPTQFMKKTFSINSYLALKDRYKD